MVETRTRERAAHPPPEPPHRRQALTITLALLTLSRLQGAVAPTAIFTELFEDTRTFRQQAHREHRPEQRRPFRDAYNPPGTYADYSWRITV